jgi:hypothetical protein
VDNGIDNPNETVVDTWASVVATQEQWDVVPMAKQLVDNSVAAADKAAVMVAEVVMEMVAVVQRPQHLLAIKDVVVAHCQLAVLVVLVDVEHNRDLEDLSDAVGRGAPIAERMNMMAQLVSFIKHIEQLRCAPTTTRIRTWC